MIAILFFKYIIFPQQSQHWVSNPDLQRHYCIEKGHNSVPIHSLYTGLSNIIQTSMADDFEHACVKINGTTETG